MLNKEIVHKEREDLREKIRSLSDENRSKFYTEYDKVVKDPDTYAVLNWFFLVGIHHFYLGNWLRGTINLTCMLFGLFIFSFERGALSAVGGIILFLIFLIEIYALFRSEIIVQDFNNQEMRKVLKELK